MYQCANNDPRSLIPRRTRSLAGLLVIPLVALPVLAQEKPAGPLYGINADISEMMRAHQQTAGLPAKRTITISDAVSIFLQQNLQLVAARYDIDTAEAEKLTARLRPNPQLDISTSDIPLKFTGPLI